MEENKKMSLEEHFAHLEEIIREMEKPDVSLDHSFGLYKEGLAAVKEANALLDGMEKAMLVLGSDGEPEEFQGGNYGF